MMSPKSLALTTAAPSSPPWMSTVVSRLRSRFEEVRVRTSSFTERSMPFKTKLMFNWKTDWGKKYETMTYTDRPHHDVKVFDLKGFVTKLKGDQPAGAGMMGGMGGMY